MLGDFWDDYETGVSQTAQDSYNAVPGVTDTSGNDAAYAGEYQYYAGLSYDSAVSAVKDAAASGRPVPQATVDTLTAQGININSIAGAAGAVFKLVSNSSGQYTAQPVNAAAQQQVASGASMNKIFILGGLAALAFAFLH